MRKSYSNYFPTYKLVLFSVLTFGLYLLYWSFKGWRIVAKELPSDEEDEELKDMDILVPLIKSIALFVPLLGLYVLYLLFDSLLRVAENKGFSGDKSHRKIAGDLISWVLAANLVGFFIPAIGLFKIIIVLAITLIPLVQLNGYMNKVWKKTDKRPIRRGLSWVEILILAFILFVVVGLAISFLTEISEAAMSHDDLSLSEPDLEGHDEENLVSSYIEPLPELKPIPPPLKVEFIIPENIEDNCNAYCSEIPDAYSYAITFDNDKYPCSCYDINDELLDEVLLE